MSTTINNHRLSSRQVEVLDFLSRYLGKNAGDSGVSNTTSPNGDGRWVPITEIFPGRTNQDNGNRRITNRLAAWGVLAACEICCMGGCLKLMPVEKMASEMKSAMQVRE